MKEEWVEVFVERSFEAAHSLSKLPPKHKCHGLHGHHYTVKVVCAGHVNPKTGFVIDYGEIKKPLDLIIKRLDHSYLNDLLNMDQPSTENLARFFWDALKHQFGERGELLDRIEVRETPSSGCVYRGKRFSHSV